MNFEPRLGLSFMLAMLLVLINEFSQVLIDITVLYDMYPFDFDKARDICQFHMSKLLIDKFTSIQ